MTPEQRAKLRAELTSDPDGRGYSQHLPDDPIRVVELLTALTETMLGALRTTTAKAWAATGPYANIIDACERHADPAQNHPCRASCLVVRDTFAAGDPIHIEEPEVQLMLAGWVATGICTQTQADNLYERAMQPASRAEILGIPAPTASDVVAAWSTE